MAASHQQSTAALEDLSDKQTMKRPSTNRQASERALKLLPSKKEKVDIHSRLKEYETEQSKRRVLKPLGYACIEPSNYMIGPRASCVGRHYIPIKASLTMYKTVLQRTDYTLLCQRSWFLVLAMMRMVLGMMITSKFWTILN